MKKRLIVTILLLALLVAAVSCNDIKPIVKIELTKGEFSQLYEVGEEFDVGLLTLDITFEGGKQANVVVEPRFVTGMSTEKCGEFELTISYGSKKVKLAYEVVLKKQLIVTVKNGDDKTQFTYAYGESMPMPNEPIKAEAYYFSEWVIEGKAVSFPYVVKSDLTIEAVFTYDLERYKAEKKETIKEIEYEKFKLSDAMKLHSAYNALINLFESSADEIEIKKACDEYEKLKSSVKNLMDLLNERIEKLNKEEYFDWQWQDIIEIKGEAYEALMSYNGGAPDRRTIYNQAIERIELVLTKAEDIAIGSYEKSRKIKELEYYVIDLNENRYSIENWKTINTILENGRNRINEAEGTKAIGNAYQAVINELSTVELLTENKLHYIDLLIGYKEALKSSDYFEAEWNEIAIIYNEAALNIRLFESGAPSVEMLYKNAIAAIDLVTTKAEDRKLAEYEKVVKCKDLQFKVEELKKAAGDKEALIAQLNNALIEWTAKINKADGRAAVAKTYSDAITAITEIYNTYIGG
ncbi:MAG: bacterial Ig-like domain-containing protein [Clostridia bacterium]